MFGSKLTDRYKPLTKEQQKERELLKERVAEHRQKLKEIGQACLSDPKFIKYREAFQAFEQLTMDDLKNYRNVDPIQYAMYVSNALAELNTFEALIIDVVMDATKKVEDK